MHRPTRRPATTSPRACDRVRTALSAQHDGEELPAGTSPTGVRRHLAVCSGCRAYARALTPLDERIAAGIAAAAPAGRDGSLLTALAEHEATRPSGVTTRQLRWLVGFAGAVQLALALPVLLGVVGPGLHAGRELGSVQLAIGVGLLLSAVQPLRAAGVLPIVVVVTALTVVVAVVDVASGAASVAGELVHVSELIGLAALWALARRTPVTAVPPVATATP